MHTALKWMCRETIQHAPATGQDDYGAPTYGARVSHPAYVEYVTRRFVNAQGQEIMSKAIVYVDGTVTVGMQDQITLSNGTLPAIQRIEAWTDPQTGQRDHVKVWF